MALEYQTPGVYIQEVDGGAKPIQGVGTAVAGFVGFTAKRPGGTQPVLVSSWSEFVDKFGGPVQGGYLFPSVYGYFLNGGGRCYVSGIGGGEGGGGDTDAPQKLIPAKSNPTTPSLLFTARKAAGEKTRVEVQPGDADESFTVIVSGPSGEEKFEGLVLAKGKGSRNVEDIINKESKLVQVRALNASAPIADRLPAAAGGALVLAEQQIPAVPATISPAEFTGDESARTGIMGMAAADDVTMVCVPDMMAGYTPDKKSMVQAVQQAMLDHCEAMGDRFAILDCPPGLSPQEVHDWRVNQVGYDTKFGALYYPWIKVAGPGRNGSEVMLPPSGHLAGLYARVDDQRGVHKAPANEVLMGTIGLEYQTTKSEQDLLNPNGVNCIRSFPGRGIRVWGARTLSSDSSWRYINVRRLFNFIEESIEEGTQWVVFEPNDRDLWERVKRDVSAFLSRVWASGALFGSTPEEAFYVKCDDELNPPAVRDAGQLIIEVGLAPVKPAEFVIFRISQMASGGSVNE